MTVKQSDGKDDSADRESNSNALAVAPDGAPSSQFLGVAGQISLVALRAATTSIPYVGGALVEATFGLHSSLKMTRLQETIAELERDVQKLSADHVDREFIKTDEFTDIVAAGLRGATQTARESKRARFRRIIIGACKPQVRRTRAETFVAAVTELSDEDVGMLRTIHRCEAEGHPDPVGAGRLPMASEALDMLQRFGLIQAPRTGSVTFRVTEDSEPERPIMTELGYAFFNWVLAPEGDGS